MEESFIAPSQQNETSPEIIKRGKIEKELTNILENYADNEESFSILYKNMFALSIEVEEFFSKENKNYKDFLKKIGPDSYTQLPDYIANIESTYDMFSKKKFELMLSIDKTIKCFASPEDTDRHFNETVIVFNKIQIILNQIQNISTNYRQLTSILE